MGRRQSRSAAIIDSKHFERDFALPAVGLPESDPDEREKWRGMVLARAEVPGGDPDWGGKSEEQVRAESRSPRKARVRMDDEEGEEEEENEGEAGDEGEEGEEGGDRDGEEREEGGEGEAGNEAREEEDGGDQAARSKKPSRQYGKQPRPVSSTSRSSRRTSAQGTKEKRDKDASSSLSEDESEGDDAQMDGVEEDGADREEHDEEQEEVKTRGKGRRQGKRKRESGSTAQPGSESDDRSPVVSVFHWQFDFCRC